MLLSTDRKSHEKERIPIALGSNKPRDMGQTVTNFSSKNSFIENFGAPMRFVDMIAIVFGLSYAVLLYN